MPDPLTAVLIKANERLSVMKKALRARMLRNCERGKHVPDRKDPRFCHWCKARVDERGREE